MDRYTYMAEFAAKPFPLEKVADKWIRSSKELRKVTNPDKQNARIGLLMQLKKEADPNNIKVLTHEYADDLGRQRRRAVGLMEQRVYPRRRNVFVDTLVGNPKGDVDKEFGNTTSVLANKLKTEYPDYGVQIKTHMPEVSELYKNKLGLEPDYYDNQFVHTGLVKELK